ncbi:hypothetical protein F8M41_005472 [Gigaspora margarita]|uniref:CCHC-type domain-containing protein n=1 Tax=Gigaspora margarita TaxID=4874 RepID=A0A8H3XA04_GIGMA|nr:hypothetical protein F8M41_005472 [Gigaspora margarita]
MITASIMDSQTQSAKQREIKCTYCKEKGHDISKCPQVTYLEEEYIACFVILTKEQAAKTQKIINKAFRNCILIDEQIQSSRICVRSLKRYTTEI